MSQSSLSLSIWEPALNQLSRELSKASYTCFIEVLRPVICKDDKLVLEAPNEPTRATVLENYSDDVRAAVGSAAGRNLDVVFSVPAERERYSEKRPRVSSQMFLNPRYTFDSFVKGPSNRFAHAVASAVADKPGVDYNPLFIYGGVGLGKTHLMHAIGNAIAEKKTDTRILYVTSERFTNDLIAAIRNDRNEEFRERYRTVDILLVDDIQFISNKEGTQEEFFHTFNALYETQKQIVISSDKPPKEIPTLEERLRSRFEWGLIADIQPPDHETRVAILWKKALLENLTIDEKVLHFIASRVESNIRELEGALTRVMAYSTLVGGPITEDMAAEALRDYFPRARMRAITPQLVAEIVADYFELNVADLSAQKRSREVAAPRQIAMFILREQTELSLKKIGEYFNRNDHTTVMHACDKVEQEMRTNPAFRTTVEDITQRVKEA